MTWNWTEALALAQVVQVALLCFTLVACTRIVVRGFREAVEIWVASHKMSPGSSLTLTPTSTAPDAPPVDPDPGMPLTFYAPQPVPGFAHVTDEMTDQEAWAWEQEHGTPDEREADEEERAKRERKMAQQRARFGDVG